MITQYIVCKSNVTINIVITKNRYTYRGLSASFCAPLRMPRPEFCKQTKMQRIKRPAPKGGPFAVQASAFAGGNYAADPASAVMSAAMSSAAPVLSIRPEFSGVIVMLSKRCAMYSSSKCVAKNSSTGVVPAIAGQTLEPAVEGLKRHHAVDQHKHSAQRGKRIAHLPRDDVDELEQPRQAQLIHTKPSTPHMHMNSALVRPPNSSAMGSGNSQRWWSRS